MGPGLLWINDKLGRENLLFCQLLFYQFQVCVCFAKSNQIICVFFSVTV